MVLCIQQCNVLYRSLSVSLWWCPYLQIGYLIIFTCAVSSSWRVIFKFSFIATFFRFLIYKYLTAVLLAFVFSWNTILPVCRYDDVYIAVSCHKHSKWLHALKDEWIRIHLVNWAEWIDHSCIVSRYPALSAIQYSFSIRIYYSLYEIGWDWMSSYRIFSGVASG